MLGGTDIDNAPPPEAEIVEQPRPRERPEARERPEPREQSEARKQPAGDIDPDMTLKDISDFVTREKVADLMAVAPALPVRDLFNFLCDVGGDLEAARRQAIRASRAPSVHPAIKRKWTPWVAPTDEAFQLQPGEADDEVMIKIDPNEAFLEWVSVKRSHHKQTLTDCMRYYRTQMSLHPR